MCGVVSSNWSINETPWQRHARSAPACQHVMSQKGHEFIQQTIEQYGEYTERKKEDKIKVSSLAYCTNKYPVQHVYSQLLYNEWSYVITL